VSKNLEEANILLF